MSGLTRRNATEVAMQAETRSSAKQVKQIAKADVERIAPGFARALTQYLEQNQKVLEQLKSLNNKGKELLKHVEPEVKTRKLGR